MDAVVAWFSNLSLEAKVGVVLLLAVASVADWSNSAWRSELERHMSKERNRCPP
jgi:hypothetical protein